MSVTVNIVQLFNPPVARNTICFMTSAVNAAFAVLQFFLKQLSSNSGYYQRFNKPSSCNPPTIHSPTQSTSRTPPCWNVREQLPVAPGYSSAPSQQHQARASTMLVLITHNSSSMPYFQHAFQSTWKEKCIPPPPTLLTLTQWVNYYAQFNKKLNKRRCMATMRSSFQQFTHYSLSFTRRMWLTRPCATPTWAQHSSSLGSPLLLQSTASSPF